MHLIQVQNTKRGERQPVLDLEGPNITIWIKQTAAGEFQHLPIPCGTGGKMLPLIWNLRTFLQFAIWRLILLISESDWCMWAPQRTTACNSSPFFFESDCWQCIDSIWWWIDISVTEAVLNLKVGEYVFMIFSAPISVSCWTATWNHEKNKLGKIWKMYASSTFHCQILVWYTVMVVITTEKSRSPSYAVRDSCSGQK